MGPIISKNKGLTGIEPGALIPKITKFQGNFDRFSRILVPTCLGRDHLSSEIIFFIINFVNGNI